ncbi:acyl-CoA dehydrogenase [Azospirillum sp. ST 5-10]|uniref:acyl-CoA dehydrogenase n=1 Tax=unclassified Azospirillum TaxID=2630922 RepID=UPI003F49E82A
MSYRAPVEDILFTLEHVAGLGAVLRDGLFPGLDGELVRALLDQAGAFGEGVLAPLDRPGDREGVRFADGAVISPAGFRDAYRRWAEAGWNGVAAPEAWGGAGLPVMLNTAVMEMHTSACMAFGLGPVLTQGAVDALLAHAAPELQERYLPKLVSGEWTATMNLTEPQAGTDLALLRTRAVPAGDGSYRLSGQKIFITCGEHDLADNIVHLVLARLPEAPPGTKGISLFLVPKRLVNPDGSPGEANDVRCAGVEHKLGLHASPTCTMVYGERGGAIGWLVGEENRGLACMFTMMNRARLATGLQGVSIAERATQQALAYARERRQGRAPGAAGTSAIIEHPDVRRMLLTMRALTAAGRAIAYVTAEAIDRAEHGGDAAAQERADLLTPVAKAFCTDAGIEAASLNIQVHGGMGYVEETGAAQLYRDVRVTAIYEGTNGVQAVDLATRKLPRRGGEPVRALIAEWRAVVADLVQADPPDAGATAPRLAEAFDALADTTAWLLAEGRAQADVLAGATPYLRLFALAAGGALLARGALAAHRLRAGGDGDPALGARIATARFFAENLAVAAPGLARTVTAGAGTLGAGADPFSLQDRG